MGKPKLNKTPIKKNGHTKTRLNIQANKDEDKKQTKISSYFSKNSSIKNIPKPSNSILVPNLKKFSSKSKSLSIIPSNSSNVNLFQKKISSSNDSTFNDCNFSSIYNNDDSDIEIIESTPESVKRKEVTIINSDSPECIPATPHISSNSKLFSNSSKFNSFRGDFKSSSVLGKSLQLNINKNETVPISKLSLKRGAETKTGISPISKRINENSDIIVPVTCKKNLLDKMSSSVLSNISMSESEKSFSLLQPAFRDSPKPLNKDTFELQVDFDQNKKNEQMINDNLPQNGKKFSYFSPTEEGKLLNKDKEEEKLFEIDSYIKFEPMKDTYKGVELVAENSYKKEDCLAKDSSEKNKYLEDKEEKKLLEIDSDVKFEPMKDIYKEVELVTENTYKKEDCLTKDSTEKKKYLEDKEEKKLFEIDSDVKFEPMEDTYKGVDLVIENSYKKDNHFTKDSFEKKKYLEEEEEFNIENSITQHQENYNTLSQTVIDDDIDCLPQPNYVLPTALGHSFNTKYLSTAHTNQQYLDTSYNSEDSLDQLLSDNFDKFSPFKDPKPKVQAVHDSSVEKLLTEGLGSSSYAVKGNYGRYIIATIERDIYKREALLHLKSPINRASKYCILSGFWYESAIKEGDIVHLLLAEEMNNKFYISNEKGIIVINPDFLISGTSVVSGVFCQRKSVLNERFKGYDSGNKIMILGSLVHQLFQEVVQKKLNSESEISNLIKNLLSQSQVLKEFYGMSLSVVEMLEEMNNFIPLIKSWTDTYLEMGMNSMKTLPKGNWTGKVTSVKDIEENIWSPRYGIKGRIDLTIETKVGSSVKVVPLELKTGKASFSAEHKGQVTLYSMIMSDRRHDPQSGLLLYLRDGSMAEVPAGEKEKKGLIQLRNEIVKYLMEKPSGKEENELSLPSLPPPLDSKRTCNRCAHLLTCTAMQKVNGDVHQVPHAMLDLIPLATNHLSMNHLDYFRKWCLMLHLEIGATDNEASIRSLWCQDASHRESSGKCLAKMLVRGDVTDMGNGYFVHKFERQVGPGVTDELQQCFQVGESVVISSEKEIALSVGVVYVIEKYSITVVLDKNLNLLPNIRKKMLVIDRCEYQNSMSIFFTNLSELLRNNERSHRLRQLIIDRESPQFNGGLDRSLVTQIKSILVHMNKEQQRAILRSLLAKDYSILKGYPGTGKTSTIVGLVRLLNATGHSILLTSYTHSAVDNILLKLKNEDIKFLRLGKTSRIHKDILKYSDSILTKNMKTLPEIEEFYNNAKIVATTCLGMGHVLFRRKSFDFCIMDEASQVVEAAALGPLFYCSRFILVGDSLQLPPVIKSQSAKKLGMIKSLFERLDNEDATVCLSLQYRMNEPIMNVANHLIYEGQLKCGTEELKTATLENMREDGLLDTPSWLRKLVSCKLEDSFLMLDTLSGAPEEKDCGGQIVNPMEAKVIFRILQMFVKIGVRYCDVGIITPYRAQVKYLQERMASLFHTDGESAVEVNTVDQYQGRDKNIILYSCVRSGLRQEDVKKGEILNDIRRLNVAVTRAKNKLIVVGNLATLRFFEPFEKLLKNVEKHQIYELREGTNGFSWNDLKN